MTQPKPSAKCMGLYRAQLSCKIGRDALDGSVQIPDGLRPVEWAMFNLLHAVEEIATAMREEREGKG